MTRISPTVIATSPPARHASNNTKTIADLVLHAHLKLSSINSIGIHYRKHHCAKMYLVCHLIEDEGRIEAHQNSSP